MAVCGERGRGAQPRKQQDALVTTVGTPSRVDGSAATSAGTTGRTPWRSANSARPLQVTSERVVPRGNRDRLFEATEVGMLHPSRLYWVSVGTWKSQREPVAVCPSIARITDGTAKCNATDEKHNVLFEDRAAHLHSTALILLLPCTGGGF